MDCSGLRQLFDGYDVPTHAHQRLRQRLLRYVFTVVYHSGRFLMECGVLSRYIGFTAELKAKHNPLQHQAQQRADEAASLSKGNRNSHEKRLQQQKVGNTSSRHGEAEDLLMKDTLANSCANSERDITKPDWVIAHLDKDRSEQKIDKFICTLQKIATTQVVTIFLSLPTFRDNAHIQRLEDQLQWMWLCTARKKG